MATKTVRHDALPEGFTYHDTGCHLYHSCLNCPYDTCHLDHPGYLKRAQRLARAHQVLGLVHSGHSVERAAARIGVSRRTAYRWLILLDKLR